MEQCKVCNATMRKLTEKSNAVKELRSYSYPFHVIYLLNLAQTLVPWSSLQWPGIKRQVKVSCGIGGYDEH